MKDLPTLIAVLLACLLASAYDYIATLEQQNAALRHGLVEPGHVACYEGDDIERVALAR